MKPEIRERSIFLLDDVVNPQKRLVVVKQQLLIVGTCVVKITLQITRWVNLISHHKLALIYYRYKIQLVTT